MGIASHLCLPAKTQYSNLCILFASRNQRILNKCMEPLLFFVHSSFCSLASYFCCFYFYTLCGKRGCCSSIRPIWATRSVDGWRFARHDMLVIKLVCSSLVQAYSRLCVVAFSLLRFWKGISLFSFSQPPEIVVAFEMLKRNEIFRTILEFPQHRR